MRLGFHGYAYSHSLPVLGARLPSQLHSKLVIALPVLNRKTKSHNLSAACNWPNHRGTATGFPLSAFGLSAVFFASISSLLFGDNTSDFLLLLAVGTTCMIFFSIFFVRVVPNMPKYAPLSDGIIERTSSNPLKRTKSNDGKGMIEQEPGTLHFYISLFPSASIQCNISHIDASDVPDEDIDESSSLVFETVSGSGDIQDDADKTDGDVHDPHHLDIRGVAMLPKVEFYQLFMMLGLLTGIGLMTIK